MVGPVGNWLVMYMIAWFMASIEDRVNSAQKGPELEKNIVKKYERKIIP